MSEKFLAAATTTTFFNEKQMENLNVEKKIIEFEKKNRRAMAN